MTQVVPANPESFGGPVDQRPLARFIAAPAMSVIAFDRDRLRCAPWERIACWGCARPSARELSASAIGVPRIPLSMRPCGVSRVAG